MIDQATQLRQLAARAARAARVVELPEARLLLVAGGKGGVGTTTLSVHLAVSLCELGHRAVLVDANLYRADVAALCGLQEQGHIGDILAARRDIHEVLQAGPAGLQVVPGLWAPDQVTDVNEHAWCRLIQQLRSLGRYADLVLIDGGAGSSGLTRRFWPAVDDVVLVTTGEPVAIMDAYATIKSMHGSAVGNPRLWVVVNRAEEPAARDVYQRIAASCERFLGLCPYWLGWVPAEKDGAVRGVRVLQPETAQAFGRLAAALTSADGQRAAA